MSAALPVIEQESYKVGRKDPAIQKLGHFFLESPHKLHLSNEVTGRFLSVDGPEKIEPAMSTMSSVLVHADHDHFDRSELEAAAVQNGLQCLMHI